MIATDKQSARDHGGTHLDGPHAADVRCAALEYEQCRTDLLRLRNMNRTTQRDEAYLNWRYAMRPGRSKPVIVFAENKDGKKIGCLSLIPHRYAVDGTMREIGVLGDMSVEKTWRGKGVTQAMIGHLMQQEAFRSLDGAIVLPNEEAARPLHKAHWTAISRLERYVKLVDIVGKLVQHRKSNWLLTPIAWCMTRVMKFLSLETYHSESAEFSGELAPGFDERFDRLWENLSKQGMMIGCRNREHLTWRYANHPLVTHQIFTLSRRKTLCGYIVFHIVDRQCSIDDILCIHDATCARRLISSFLNFVSKNSLAFSIDIKMNPDNFLRRHLRLFGFIRRPEYLPLMLAQRDASKPLSLFTSGSKWYLTANDKDV